MLTFLKPTLDDYSRIHPYCSAYGENSCQHSFVNLFTLYEKYGSHYCIQDGFLYVFRSHQCPEGFRTYLFPMGEGDERRAVWNLMEDAHRNHAKIRFHTITEKKKDFLEKEFPGIFRIEEVRDYAEYIHSANKLAHLPGKQLKGKRRAESVRRKYEGRIEETLFTKEEIGEVLAFERQWLERSRETHDAEALMLEYREIENQLQCFDILGITGVIIRIDQQIQGFAYGLPLSDSCIDEVIEKGNREISYLYNMLQQDFALMCGKDYQYMNVEEDLGISGLRENKLSYRPDILLRKFTASEI